MQVRGCAQSDTVVSANYSTMLRSKFSYPTQDTFKSSWEISTRSQGWRRGRWLLQPPRGWWHSNQGPITSLLSLTILKIQTHWIPHTHMQSRTHMNDQQTTQGPGDDKSKSFHPGGRAVKGVDSRLTHVCFRLVRLSDHQYGFHKSWSEKTGTCWSSEPRSMRNTETVMSNLPKQSWVFKENRLCRVIQTLWAVSQNNYFLVVWPCRRKWAFMDWRLAMVPSMSRCI